MFEAPLLAYRMDASDSRLYDDQRASNATRAKNERYSRDAPFFINNRRGLRQKSEAPACVLYGRKRRSKAPPVCARAKQCAPMSRINENLHITPRKKRVLYATPRPSSKGKESRGKPSGFPLVAFFTVFPDGKTVCPAHSGPARRGRPRGSGGESHSNIG